MFTRVFSSWSFLGGGGWYVKWLKEPMMPIRTKLRGRFIFKYLKTVLDKRQFLSSQNKNKIVLKLKLEKQISLQRSLKYEKQIYVSTWDRNYIVTCQDHLDSCFKWQGRLDNPNFLISTLRFSDFKVIWSPSLRKTYFLISFTIIQNMTKSNLTCLYSI